MLIITYVIARVPEVLGYQTDYLEGRSFYELVHPEDLSVFKSFHKACE